MNKSMNLFLLQQIDLQLDALFRRENEINAGIANRTAIQGAETALQQAASDLESAEAKLKDIDRKSVV